VTSRCRPAAALAGLVLALAALGCREPRPVRVVLVTLDTVRLDCLLPPQPAAAAPGAEAEGGSGMPLLFARARSGALFERFYAATSVTQPSHASMLTALHPWEHGVVSNGQVLPESVVIVPEVLREAGFATAAVVASFPVASRFGFGQGFDSFYEEFTEDPVADRRWEGHDVPEDRFYSLADTVTDRALERLDELDGSAGGESASQFLWVHYFDAHDPYGDTGEGPRHAVPRALTLIEQGKDVGPLLVELRRAYDRDVAFLDRHLDRLLARLEADAGRFETHVVIASDHGESFGEGGALAHGMRLTEEQIRVPLVILSPRLPPGVRPDVAGSVDVARTLLALAGVAAGEPWTRARDLAAGLAGPAERGAAGALGMRRTFWTKNPTELRTDGTVHSLSEPLFYAVDRSGRVFRGNGRGLSETPPEAGAETVRGVERLFALFEERIAGGTAPAAADDETLEALRALGYVN
jgi:arylsulfatase A-like enzyme